MLVQNIRYALRLLRKSPGFTAIAVATLALGIGANTAVFSVVDAVMLKPLAYPDPDRLVALWEGRADRPQDAAHGPATAVAPANLVDYSRDNRTFETLASFDARSMSLTQSGAPEQLLGEAVSWNYLATLGAQPAIGRGFTRDDDRPGGDHVVILTNAAWRDRFGADPSILGRSIRLNAESYTVVGVMPAGFTPAMQFESIRRVEFLVPAAYPDDLLANHGDHECRVVGRLKPGVTLVQAQSDIDGIVATLAKTYPSAASGLQTRLAPLARDITRGVRTSLLVLLGAVALVLLISCVNVANLLIVRAVGHRRDVAVRLALGAGRGQIMFETITRCVVLGVLGGVAGALVGVWTRDGLVAIAPATLPRIGETALNRDVFLLTLALSLVTGIVTGLLPAWQAARTDAGGTLKASVRGASDSRALVRWRGALMAGEIAAALVLAVGAGLLVRSLVTLTRVDLGFQTTQVLAANIALPETRYDDARKRLAFFESLTERVRGLPGVEAAGFANRFPLRGGWSSSANFEGTAPMDFFVSDFQAVSGGYFAALGIRLVRGRLVTETDRIDTMRAAVVNETFARKVSPDRDPLGRRFQRSGKNQSPITIVGVVGDIRRDGKQATIQPEVYLPAAQTDLYPVRLADFAVRTAGDPRSLVHAIQDAVLAIDPDQPITDVRTLDEVVSASMAERRFDLILLTAFAVLAVALALVGVYGVVAYAASERTREIGIRMALGANRRDVVRLVVRAAVGWSLAGIAAGVAGAVAASRLLGSLLFNVTPTDPLTFTAMALVMMAVALTASYIPARRAASVDPIVALRTE